MRNLKRPKSRKKEGGFSLVDVIIAISLAALAIVLAMGIITQANRVRRQENARTSVVGARDLIFNLLNRYDHFQATINSASNAVTFACLLTRTCVANVEQSTKFVLMYVPEGMAAQSYMNLTSNFVGIGLNGDVCTTTGVAVPNVNCPIQVLITWTPLCNGCNPGLVRFRVRLFTYQADNPTAAQVRESGYGFTLLKSVY